MNPWLKQLPGTVRQRKWGRAYRRCCECPLCWPRKWATESRHERKRKALKRDEDEL